MMREDGKGSGEVQWQALRIMRVTAGLSFEAV